MFNASKEYADTNMDVQHNEAHHPYIEGYSVLTMDMVSTNDDVQYKRGTSSRQYYEAVSSVSAQTRDRFSIIAKIRKFSSVRGYRQYT